MSKPIVLLAALALAALLLAGLALLDETEQALAVAREPPPRTRIAAT